MRRAFERVLAIDAGEIEVLCAQRSQAGIHVGHRRVQLRQAGVHQHARIGVVDDVDVDRHSFTLDVQVGDEDRRDGDRGIHRAPTVSLSVAGRSK